MKQHGANQIGGRSRKALTAFSASVPSTCFAPLSVQIQNNPPSAKSAPTGRTTRTCRLGLFLCCCFIACFSRAETPQNLDRTSQEPSPSPNPLEHNLVNVATIYPPLLQEIRYATACNFTGQVLYPFPAAFVHRDVAAALQRVQQDLRKEGLCLKIFDGYRPGSIQFKMWELVRDERYVSDPIKGKGKHTRGTAVDVTLVDRLGNELAMPTVYDDFSEKAHRSSATWTKEQRTNSLKLEAVMKKHGFIPFPFEWWHFDYVGWENYPSLDISFESLARDGKNAVGPR
jgi:D-alanyl-D-alanine dipeptidase